MNRHSADQFQLIDGQALSADIEWLATGELCQVELNTASKPGNAGQILVLTLFGSGIMGIFHAVEKR